MTESHSHSGDPNARLAAAIAHAAHLLPAQGPITVFIHHNTLHAFEHLPFDEALVRGSEAFGCQPYLTETRYRAELTRGRIAPEDLRAIGRRDLQDRAGEIVFGSTTRLELRLALLQDPAWNGTAAELEYALEASDSFRRIQSDVAAATGRGWVADIRRWVLRDLRAGDSDPAPNWAKRLIEELGSRNLENWSEAKWETFAVRGLWDCCSEAVQGQPARMEKPAIPARPRDALVELGASDPDLPVHDLLIRFTAAFLDQGLAPWTLPERERGYFQSFLAAHSGPGQSPAASWKRLRSECVRISSRGMSPLDCIAESLELLGIAEADWEGFFGASFLALRGWGGMVHQVETRGDSVAHPIPAGTLTEFVAVRLLLDRLAGDESARECGIAFGKLGDFIRAERFPPRSVPTALRVYPLFQLAQGFGWPLAKLRALNAEGWAHLLGEIESFGALERRRVFHLAYERRFRQRSLNAIGSHIPFRTPEGFRPRYQAITCLDEREESFRRHLEEVAPDCETFGAAGFFNVAIYYRGASDAHFIPVCPIVLTPGHWIEEKVLEPQAGEHDRRKKFRRWLGNWNHRFQSGSRSFWLGAVLSAGFGVLASIPLVARILFPRLSGRLRHRFSAPVRTPSDTRLKLERTAAKAAPEPDGVGYALAEMATTAERLLRDIGMTGNFARLVFVLGHGSDSLNNPHKSAYDCGACGGNPGSANGRALAAMLNDPRVRSAIAANGIAIPADTVFVGGYHNTCDDSVSISDRDLIPESHRADLARAEVDFAAACERNAHERCRRFMSARLDSTIAEAQRHVQNRSEDLAQVRPELGHATNAICFVGRRSRSRGLYLDRRAFLASYDPYQDDAEGSTLARLLGAAVPVCGGINLEYYFSHVDSPGYGCGTKLPHNVTGLLGVMDGAASDLRTGLPWQMVEIHEPVRLLFVVETTAEVLLKVMGRNATVGNMIRNGWVLMNLLDPDSGAIRVYRDGEFIPFEPDPAPIPRAASSIDWYRGWRDHLDFAEIGPNGGVA